MQQQREIQDLSPTTLTSAEPSLKRYSSLGPSMRKFVPAEQLPPTSQHNKSSSSIINDKLVQKVASVRRVQSEITPEQHAAILAKQNQLQQRDELEAVLVNSKPHADYKEINSEDDGNEQQADASNFSELAVDDDEDDFEFIEENDEFLQQEILGVSQQVPSSAQLVRNTPSFYAEHLKLSLPSTAFSGNNRHSSSLSSASLNSIASSDAAVEPSLKSLGNGLFDVFGLNPEIPSMVLSNNAIAAATHAAVNKKFQQQEDSVESVTTSGTTSTTTSITSRSSFDQLIRGIFAVYAFPIILIMVIFKRFTTKKGAK